MQHSRLPFMPPTDSDASDTGSGAVVPAAVRDLPQTATATYLLLDRCDSLSYTEITAELGASRRAVETALRGLVDAGVVVATPDPGEPCRKQFSVINNTITSADSTEDRVCENRVNRNIEQ